MSVFVPARGSKKDTFFLLLILCVVLGIQGAKIGRPYVGHFASYQGTVMASIARNMARENFSQIFLPKTDALIFQPVRSLHLNQYPLPAFIAALGFKGGGGSFEFWGRFQAILFNLLTITLVMLIATQMFDPKVGMMAALVYGLSPYTLVYGQTFLSEAAAVFFLMASLALIAKPETAGSIRRVGLSAFFFSLATLNRFHFIVFLPAFFFLAFWGRRGDLRFLQKVSLFLVLCLILPFLWYGFTFLAPHYYDNIHTTLFMQLGSPKTSEIPAASHYWRNFSEIVCIRMLTPCLLPFFITGFFMASWTRERVFLVLNIAAGFALAVLFPKKVLDHDFYLYGVFPFIAIWTSFALVKAFAHLKSFKSALGILGLLCYLAFSVRIFSHVLYAEPAQEVASVETAQKITPLLTDKDLLIIVRRGSPTFSYYLDHPSWSIDPDALGKSTASYLKSSYAPRSYPGKVAVMENAMKDLITWYEYLKNMGATIVVVPHREDLANHGDFLQYLRKHTQPLSKEDDPFFLFRIHSS